MIRAAIFSVVVAASLSVGVAPSFAYIEGPWCLNANTGRAVANICHFRTIEQCLAERSFYGGKSFCGQNPLYLPYWRARGYHVRELR